MDFLPILQELVAEIKTDSIEPYNEACVQYELAFLLKQQLGTEYKIQLEMNVHDVKDEDFILKEVPEKKEMDIFLRNGINRAKHCIELKVPKNGQYPEQMFSACKDIKFLEQLVSAGFKESFFLMFVDDPLFYCGEIKSQIYTYFRGKEPIGAGARIEKPTGQKGKVKPLEIQGTYRVTWLSIRNNLKYFVIKIDLASLGK
jgi:hypothetical protein